MSQPFLRNYLISFCLLPFLSSCNFFEDDSKKDSVTISNYSQADFVAYLSEGSWKQIETSSKAKSLSVSEGFITVLSACRNSDFFSSEQPTQDYKIYFLKTGKVRDLNLNCGRTFSIDDQRSGSHALAVLDKYSSFYANKKSLLLATGYASTTHIPDNDAVLLGLVIRTDFPNGVYYEKLENFNSDHIDHIFRPEFIQPLQLGPAIPDDLASKDKWRKTYITATGNTSEYISIATPYIPNVIRSSNDGFIYSYRGDNYSVNIPSYDPIVEDPNVQLNSWHSFIEYTDDHIFFSTYDDNARYTPNSYQLSVLNLESPSVKIDVIIDADLVKDNKLAVNNYQYDFIKLEFNQLFSQVTLSGSGSFIAKLVNFFELFAEGSNKIQDLTVHTDIVDLPSGPAGSRPRVSLKAGFTAQ